MNINKILAVAYVISFYAFPHVSFASPIRIFPSYSDISSICSFSVEQPNVSRLVEKLPGNGWLTGGSGGYFGSFGDYLCNNNASSNGWQSLLGYTVTNGRGAGDYLFLWDFQVYSGGSNFSSACYSAGSNNLNDCLSQGTDFYAIGHWDGYVWDFGGVSSSTPVMSGPLQFALDGSTLISEGTTTQEPVVVFRSTPFSAESNLVKLQVELKQVGQSFDSTSLLESNFVDSGNSIEIVNYLATPGGYHWRARVVDDKGNASAWQEFGVSGNVDFVANNKYEAYGTNKQLVDTASEVPGAHYVDGGANIVYQTLGTGLVGIIDPQYVSFSGRIGGSSSSGNISILCSSTPFDTNINIGHINYDCGASNYVVGSYYGSSNFAHPLWSSNTPEWSNILDPSKYYILKFDNSSSGYSSESVNGSNVDVYSGGQCYIRNLGAPYNAVPCNTLADVYFDLGTNIGDSSLKLVSLGQYNSDGTTPIVEGADTTDSTIIFKAAPISAGNTQVKLQIEFKDILKPFDATSLLESGFVDSGVVVEISKESIPEGAYHWRARAVGGDGVAGVWQEVGVLNYADVVVTHKQLVFDTTLPSHKEFSVLKAGLYPYVKFPTGNSGVINSVSFYAQGATSTDALSVGLFENFSYTSYYSSYTQFYKNSACSIPAYTPVPLNAGVVNFSFDGLYMRTYPWNSDKGGLCLSATPGYTVSPNSYLTIWTQSPSITFFGSSENFGDVSCSQGYSGCSPISSLYLSFNDSVPASTPAISSLLQLKSDAVTSITEGATTTESTLVFGATIASARNNQVKLQVELKETNQAFDGLNLLESGFVTSSSTVTTTSSALTEGLYHWRARAVDDKGNTSHWVEFGAVGNTDVVLDIASNVLFLPGIMGSRLFENGSDCGVFTNEKERWVSTWDCDHARLELNQEGKSINPLYTKEGAEGVIDDTYTLNIYQSFMDDLKKWKDTEKIINDYSLVAYDWRLSLEDILQNGATSTGKLSYSNPQGFTEGYIYGELKRLADSSKTKKVTIVAHSNGGLVTKALIQKLKETNDPLYDKIDNVIFVAVPQSGTPEAVVRLLHGKELGFGFVMNAERLRELSQNMPVAYNLLPSTDYFWGSGMSVDTSVVTFEAGRSTQSFFDTYGRTITSAANLKRFLMGEDGRSAPGYNDLINPSVLASDNLLTDAEDVHNKLDDSWEFSSSTSIYQIAGWGEDTLATINYRTIPGCDKINQRIIEGKTYYRCGQWGRGLTFDPKEVIDGDGTVVTPSALAMSTSTERVKRYWVDLRDYDTYFNYERAHADVLEVSSIRTFTKNILTGSNINSLDFISTTPPLYTGGNERLRFVLHSPLNLSATDSLGNIESSATSTIPGGRWKSFGEVQVITVPKGTSVTLNLDGYAEGSFTLVIQEINGLNEITASSTIEAIPSATSTKATMQFTAGTLQSATPLLVDYDGDGNTDFTITPIVGETVGLDTTPPEVRISASISTQKLVFEGIDDTATSVLTFATSTIVVDQSGNTLQVMHSKSSREKKEIKLEIKALKYNGEFATSTPRASLQYEWSVDKNSKIKELEQRAEAGNIEVVAHYNAKKNVTEIITKTKEERNDHHKNEKDSGKKQKEHKEVLAGLVVVELVTNKGVVSIDY